MFIAYQRLFFVLELGELYQIPSQKIGKIYGYDITKVISNDLTCGLLHCSVKYNYIYRSTPIKPMIFGIYFYMLDYFMKQEFKTYKLTNYGTGKKSLQLPFGGNLTIYICRKPLSQRFVSLNELCKI